MIEHETLEFWPVMTTVRVQGPLRMVDAALINRIGERATVMGRGLEWDGTPIYVLEFADGATSQVPAANCCMV